MDWSWVQTFVVTAELGSQNAAARALGFTQPTVGRHLEALEDHLGTSLLVRSNRGVQLTDAGRALYEQSSDLRARFEALSRTAHGTHLEPEGVVRISVNEPVAVQFLPTWYQEVRSAFPKIELELVVENRTANLSRRDADIAVRMFQPEQQGLVAKYVGSSAVHLYAHEDYLRRAGEPKLEGDLSPHTILGSDRDPSFIEFIRKLGLAPGDFMLRTDSLLLQTQCVLSAVGIGALHEVVAAKHPKLVRVLSDLPLPEFPLWVVTHESLRRQQSVWAIFRALSAYLKRKLETTMPPDCSAVV
jgi:DNA-binding transcriptional LysR family regulator